MRKRDTLRLYDAFGPIVYIAVFGDYGNDIDKVCCRQFSPAVDEVSVHMPSKSFKMARGQCLSRIH